MIFSDDSTCLNDIYNKFKNNKKLLKLTNQKIRESRQISKENKELASKIFYLFYLFSETVIGDF